MVSDVPVIKSYNAEKFRNKSITIMGLGRFGGGLGAAKFLAENGALVTVTDLKEERELSESVSLLKNLGIRFVLGRHEIGDFTGADMVVVSPAVPGNSEYITEARKAGVMLQTEVGLFIQLCPAQICGVTGSNGKTTTVSMMQNIFEYSDHSFWVGGNIGGSLLPFLSRISPEDRVVLELSSFQLEWLGEMKWSPQIAAVLNLTPNHLDRHISFEMYKNAKGNILEYQKSTDMAVLVRDNSGSRALSDRVRGSLVWVGTDLDCSGITLYQGWITERIFKTFNKIFDTTQLKVPGGHNILNAMTAVACTREMGVNNNSISKGLLSFKGIPHRLEFVGECNGIKFYNDSKATTPESTVAAVNAFETGVIPILGGYDKGITFDNMAQKIAGKIQWAAVIGTTAKAISKALENVGLRSTIFNSLEEAFTGCVSRAKEGDVILLSPACASFDMFPDYEKRGEVFKSLVSEYITKTH